MTQCKQTSFSSSYYLWFKLNDCIVSIHLVSEPLQAKAKQALALLSQNQTNINITCMFNDFHFNHFH